MNTGAASVRMVLALMGASLMMSGAANASSFVLVQPPSEKVSKSFVHLGLPAPENGPVAAAVSPRPQETAVQASVATTEVKFQPAQSPTKAEKTRTVIDAANPAVPLAFALPDGSGTTIRTLSPSIIAFDESFPAVAFEKVAAIPLKKAKPLHRSMETVAQLIRGGIVESGVPGVAMPAAPAPIEVRAPASASGKLAGRPGADRKRPPPPEEPVQKAPPPPINLPRLSGPE